jgi:hypothetical protein
LKRRLEMTQTQTTMTEFEWKEKAQMKERQLESKCNQLENRLNEIKTNDRHSKRNQQDVSSFILFHFKKLKTFYFFFFWLKMVKNYEIERNDLRDRLHQAQVTIKSMQDYIDHLKSSYWNYFKN